ncbi:hypothetical protein BJ085DRAFT_28198 [Dimargaris cristalligena]|uniref:Uncharacterized protein n=1 Tax=Dimargaris cristalligena TaxID=215637 RepID=A0A4V1J5T5_9FUNG|nr:hypothetical protein BJ085DRAFT_28198 [Dimargaris cristalligena]|eukprot:RKP40179.1 hypothetical protein BJ085DRAFT_28198 [Dimargaris cristalligena]
MVFPVGRAESESSEEHSFMVGSTEISVSAAPRPHGHLDFADWDYWLEQAGDGETTSSGESDESESQTHSGSSSEGIMVPAPIQAPASPPSDPRIGLQLLMWFFHPINQEYGQRIIHRLANAEQRALAAVCHSLRLRVRMAYGFGTYFHEAIFEDPVGGYSPGLSLRDVTRELTIHTVEHMALHDQLTELRKFCNSSNLRLVSVILEDIDFADWPKYAEILAELSHPLQKLAILIPPTSNSSRLRSVTYDAFSISTRHYLSQIPSLRITCPRNFADLEGVLVTIGLFSTLQTLKFEDGSLDVDFYQGLLPYLPQLKHLRVSPYPQLPNLLQYWEHQVFRGLVVLAIESNHLAAHRTVAQVLNPARFPRLKSLDWDFTVMEKLCFLDQTDHPMLSQPFAFRWSHLVALALRSFPLSDELCQSISRNLPGLRRLTISDCICPPSAIATLIAQCSNLSVVDFGFHSSELSLLGKETFCSASITSMGLNAYQRLYDLSVLVLRLPKLSTLRVKLNSERDESEFRQLYPHLNCPQYIGTQ